MGTSPFSSFNLWLAFIQVTFKRLFVTKQKHCNQQSKPNSKLNWNWKLKWSLKKKKENSPSPPRQCTSPDRWRSRRWSCCSANQRLRSCSHAGPFLWPWTFWFPSFPRLGWPFCSLSSVVGGIRCDIGEQEYNRTQWSKFLKKKKFQNDPKRQLVRTACSYLVRLLAHRYTDFFGGDLVWHWA